MFKIINKNLLNKKRIETKKEILEKIKVCNKLAVVRPFGFGKTFTILELCKELKGKKLIIEPSNSIIEYIKNNITENTDCITYRKLIIKNFNVNTLLEYDYIFFDEFHRTLAPKWGKVIKDLLPKFKGKIIGFTATPTRGDGKEPIIDIFENNQISTLGLVESIVQGLLINPTYVSGIYEIDNKKIYNKQLKKQLANYNFQVSLNNIFNKYLDLNKSLHLLLFSDKIDNIEENARKIEKWFEKDIKTYKYHSRQSLEENEKNLKEFLENKKDINILCSVNQLNEGIHLKNIDGIIFLRKTKSDVVYLQQLGRALSENLKKVVVFDLVNNYKRNLKGYPYQLKQYLKKNKLKEVKNIYGQELTIYLEQQDLIDMLSKNFLSKKEKIFIKENALKLSAHQIAVKLNRSDNTIIYYMNKNAIKHNNKPKGSLITKKEVDFVLKNYKKMTRKKLKETLNRSYDTIRKILEENGKFVNQTLAHSFTKQEEKFILDNHKKMTCSKMGKILGVTDGIIIRYLERNNLERCYLKDQIKGE